MDQIRGQPNGGGLQVTFKTGMDDGAYSTNNHLKNLYKSMLIGNVFTPLCLRINRFQASAPMVSELLPGETTLCLRICA
jgi:hypothetical protein